MPEQAYTRYTVWEITGLGDGGGLGHFQLADV